MSDARHFVNLTNGLEWASELSSSFSFIRIESTMIEKGDWDALLRDLDANLLMSLALGYECHVYDCGTRREMSKTISVGLPFIRNALRVHWINGVEMEARTQLRQELKRKLNYFRRYLNTDDIRLIGHSRATTKDGDWSYYRGLAINLAA